MKQIIFLFSTIGVLVAIVVMPKDVFAQAAPIVMMQKINPIICVVDKISDFDGTTMTMNTKGCGTFIYPQDFNDENGLRLPLSNQLLLTGISTARRANISRQRYVPIDKGLYAVPTKPTPSPIYISGQEGANMPGGFIVIASIGSKFAYRLFGDSPILEPRIFEIKNIQGGEVEIYFQDASQNFKLQEGQRTFVDVGYDSLADVTLKVESIEMAPRGSAVLRVVFPWQPRMEDKAIGTRESLVAMTVIGLLGAVTMIANIGHRKRNAHIPPPAHWHFIQHIEAMPKSKKIGTVLHHAHKTQTLK